ncbi:hypothetical protein Tco_0132201 [Tanacetum coccineum]
MTASAGRIFHGILLSRLLRRRQKGSRQRRLETLMASERIATPSPRAVNPSFINNLVRAEKRLAHMEQPLMLIPLPVAPVVVHDAYYALYDAQKEMACTILASMSLDLQRTLENYNEIDMLQELRTMFEEQAKHKLFKIVKAFHA